MRELFRLLLVAVLSFGVVGAALLYSRNNDALGELSALLNPGSQQTVAQTEPVAEPAADTRLWIARPARDQWMGLAGFPDQFDTRFPLPAGISFVGGSLELEFQSELAEHGDGRMTILVNGTRRGEVVLNTGRETHKVNIALEPEDMLGNYVRLELAGRGTTNSGQICPTDAANSGAAITLMPSSGLVLYTNDAIDRPEVKLASLSEPMALVLGSDTDAQAMAIWAAQKMGRAGLGVHLGGTEESGALIMAAAGGQALALDAQDRLVMAGAAGVDRVIAQRKPFGAVAPVEWPVSAYTLGVETLAKNFRGSRRWTLPYQIADMPAGLMPRQLELNLKTSKLTEGNDWVVRVSLNGNLLTSERFPGAVDTISMSIEMPTDLQGLTNAVLVELIDTTPNDSICRAGPDAQAQLLPSTQFTPTGGQPAIGWGEMVRALARAETIGLSTDETLSLAQAQWARALLASFLPANANMVFGEDANNADVELSIVPVGRLMASLDVASRLSGGTVEADSNLFFVVGGIEDGAGQPTLLNLADAESRAWFGAHSPTEVGILIAR